MRYHALACDYDGTIATDGRVDDETFAALERVGRSGRRLILVTGRELDDLRGVFPHLELFTWVVAENGGLLFEPGTRRTEVLAEPPPDALVAALREREADPLSVGRVIVGTRRPYDRDAVEVIAELGLERQVVFNKGAVMILPSGVNKATGLAAALAEMRMSRHSVVGVGDAENDHAFLDLCELSVAVGNALPAVKERCDLVTEGERGAGVVELADRLLDGDLGEVTAELRRHHVLLGERPERGDRRPGGYETVHVAPYGTGALVAGPSGSGKSTAVSGLLERVLAAEYQVCLIDPEGDYDEAFPSVDVIGTPDRAPAVEEVMGLLDRPDRSVVVNLLAIRLADRPAFFAELLPRLVSKRARTGHPHWLAVDEAHHLLPVETPGVPIGGVADVGALLLITVHPGAVAGSVLRLVDTVVAVGRGPARTFAEFAEAAGQRPPDAPEGDLDSGELCVWRVGEERAVRTRLVPGQVERQRHSRKYAAGTLPESRSFYFRGPEGRLRLRAPNLDTFLQLADGVDDGTWAHHLRRGDYSRWMREDVDDPELADQVAEVERDGDADARDGRDRVRALVEARYTLPAEPTRYDPDHDATGEER